ncbi:MAG TPA: hypothetical protein VFU60_06390 [Ktedonobacterales bacterium]|nr:hypothetical protein [Ktedonobacterales bacterium]
MDALNDNPSVRLWGSGTAETTCASCVDLIEHRATTRLPRWAVDVDEWDSSEADYQRPAYSECRKRRLLTNENARQQPTRAACRWYVRRREQMSRL